MKNKFRKTLCLLIALIMLLAIMIMAGCTPDKDSESSDDALKAADPMTEEEMMNDDSEGCIEDSEDLLN